MALFNMPMATLTDLEPPVIEGTTLGTSTEIYENIALDSFIARVQTDSPVASFTITNLGSFGIESFTPVLNAPQTGILGVNTITQKMREVDGEIKLYPSMGLSLTIDHGAIDGAPAARFLQDLGKALENFTLTLMK